MEKAAWNKKAKKFEKSRQEGLAESDKGSYYQQQQWLEEYDYGSCYYYNNSPDDEERESDEELDDEINVDLTAESVDTEQCTDKNIIISTATLQQLLSSTAEYVTVHYHWMKIQSVLTA